MKAVNMKNYRFGTKGFAFMMEGFGMYDEETDSFASIDGRVPYVLRTKKAIEACIEADFPNVVCRRRVKPN